MLRGGRWVFHWVIFLKLNCRVPFVMARFFLILHVAIPRTVHVNKKNFNKKWVSLIKFWSKFGYFGTISTRFCPFQSFYNVDYGSCLSNYIPHNLWDKAYCVLNACPAFNWKLLCVAKNVFIWYGSLSLRTGMKYSSREIKLKVTKFHIILKSCNSLFWTSFSLDQNK